jgi:hypothetical protein
MGDPAEILSKLLGGPVKLYVTRCSLLELKGLGNDFSGERSSATPYILLPKMHSSSNADTHHEKISCLASTEESC